MQRYIFWIFEKGFGIAFPPHFVPDFSRKLFPMLYSINWPNFIVWVPLFLEISSNICIVIVSFPVFDVTNFEIYLKFLIKVFSYVIKKSEEKLKYPKIDRSLFQSFRRFFLIFSHYGIIRTLKLLMFNALDSKKSGGNACNRYVFLRLF